MNFKSQLSKLVQRLEFRDSYVLKYPSDAAHPAINRNCARHTHNQAMRVTTGFNELMGIESPHFIHGACSHAKLD